MSINGINSATSTTSTNSSSAASTAKGSSGLVFEEAQKETERVRAEKMKELEEKEAEYNKFDQRLKYLKGDAELVAKHEEKQRSNSKIAGISGFAAGGIGTGLAFASTGLAADIGVGLACVLGGGAVIIGAGIAAGAAALAVEGYQAYKNNKEAKNRDAEIVEIEQKMQNLQKEISTLRTEIN